MCWCTALAAAPVAGGRMPPPSLCRRRRRIGSSVRAEASLGGETQRKKVAVAGSGWAGLAAAHHLIKQVEFPIFHDQPWLPAPFGTVAYPEFPGLPLIDRLTSIHVITADTKGIKGVPSAEAPTLCGVWGRGFSRQPLPWFAERLIRTRYHQRTIVRLHQCTRPAYNDCKGAF